MKAEVRSISSRRHQYDEGKLDVTLDLKVTDIRDLFGVAGKDIYIYPKSRWGMFIDWLLRA